MTQRFNLPEYIQSVIYEFWERRQISSLCQAMLLSQPDHRYQG